MIHCFTASAEFGRKALDLGFYISISGIVTFKNAKDLQDIAPRLPLIRLLVETDAPFLAPVPHRGKTCEPAFVRDTLEFVAALRGVSARGAKGADGTQFFPLVYKGSVMNGDDSARLLYAVMAMVFVASSLFAYRLPIAKMAKLVLAWLGIFAALFLIFSFRPEMKRVWNRVSGELTGAPRQEIALDAISLTRQDDGHFWLRANVNGKAVDFMVDTGASFTALNATTADELQIQWREVLPHVDIETANGRVKANRVELGEISDRQIYSDRPRGDDGGGIWGHQCCRHELS